MRPLVIRGEVWGVVRVSPGNPFLVDRTGVPRLATCDPLTKTIRISTEVPPDMFDQVYLHEVSHAIMEESGVRLGVTTEELMAWFLEHHAIEAIDAASRSLGRAVCVRGTCADRSQRWR